MNNILLLTTTAGQRWNSVSAVSAHQSIRGEDNIFANGLEGVSQPNFFHGLGRKLRKFPSCLMASDLKAEKCTVL